MLTSILKTTIIATVYMSLLAVGGSVYAMDTDLVGLLTKSLNITTPQAEGGAGALFKAASENMSAEDFATVSNALPEIQALMDSVPASGSGSGSLGSLTSAFGKSGSSVSSLAGLAGMFSQLGLGSDMVQQFIPIVLDYAQNKGGDTVAQLLKMALQ